MGGDHAPEVPVAGAISALAELEGDFELALVGDEARIRTLLHGREYPPERFHMTDGFTGNVVLKFAESFLDFLTDAVRDEIHRRPLERLGALLMRPALRAVKRRIDYSEYGGAPLLGVDGVVIIAHGGSDPKAVRNAIRVALRAADRELHHRIAGAVSAWTGDAVLVNRSGNQVLGGPP